jgi:UDP-3-O-[3-hydroxymyristoyl] N-acetylglucosamine deacetylase
MAFSSGVAQKTLNDRVTLSGIGVHGGKPVSLSLCPADPNTGVVFVRTGLPGADDVEIPAVAGSVGATELCTLLGDPRGVFVATVEHLLSALVGLGVDNVIVELDGPEVPVMDGSAAVFVEAIDSVGLVRQAVSKRYLKILKPVRVTSGAAFAEFLPHEGCRFEVGIEYDCSVIGSQTLAVEITPRTYRKQIARARTFGYMRDVERLWAAGYALGSSLENSVVIGDGMVVNPEGLRYRDEFVRHKILDAVGDLALAGAPIQGLYRSFRGGHKLNAMALEALLARRDAWAFVSASANHRSRTESRADLVAGLIPRAFASKVA